VITCKNCGAPLKPTTCPDLEQPFVHTALADVLACGRPEIAPQTPAQRHVGAVAEFRATRSFSSAVNLVFAEHDLQDALAAHTAAACDLLR